MHFFVNDVLMVLFFFVVGLEIRREINSGELASFSKSSLPIGAAIGGMIAPAAMYLFCTYGTKEQSGWGVPMATDIAFALGVLSLFGSRIPHGLKIFLTSLAIVDDIGAILVIAFFYSKSFSFFYLAIVFILAVVLFLLRKSVSKRHIVFTVFAILLWYGTLLSGIHATIAGIILAFLVPESNASQYEDKLHSFVAFCIMPLFALVNAGVPISLNAFMLATELQSFWGIILGLVLGKPLGIMLAVFFLVRFFNVTLPQNVNFLQMFGVSLLAGVGFTMSIFIANLAFDNDLEPVKISILVASLSAALLGGLVLTVFRKANF
jgi:NhaA family Na+:H+ antiporter